MNSDKIICEKCGSEMISIEDFYTLGMECPNCGWGWVTTKDNPIMLDKTEYTVIIKSIDKTLDCIKTISRISNHNFLETKKILDNLPANIFKGKAYEL